MKTLIKRNFPTKVETKENKLRTLVNLAKNDFSARYTSSFLGLAWAYIQPLINLLVMWYVFQVGLRSVDIDNVPFIVWFAPASLAWTFASDCISSTTTCMKEYSYLVCKVKFDIKTIPLIKVMSASFVHVAFIFFLYFLCAVYELPFTVYSLQLWYYFLCMLVLLIGLGWMLAAITPFAPDMQSVVNVILQIGFWTTPIVWNANDMSPFVQAVVKLNPMYYICTGYRDSLINHVWFWERWDTSIYYWALSILVFICGYNLFQNMKKHMADVL